MLMSGLDAAFDQSPWELEKGRFGEYTDDDLRERFLSLDGKAIQELLSLPALFWHETGCKKAGRIGWLDEIKHAGRNLQAKFAFDPFIPEIPFDMMLELAPSLDIRMGKRELEGHRTHWAVKNVDLIAFLDERRIIDRRRLSPHAPYLIPKTAAREPMQVSPKVFETPVQPVDRRLVAVMMPFTAGFDRVYSAISQAAESAGLHAQKANDIWEHSVLIQEIFSLIYRSHVVVCDFSGKNPNVFYEAGIAHMLGRHVVPITQHHDDVPFDLRHHRYIQYLNNGEGLATLASQLSPRLVTLAAS
ncbi:hypothetical protein [Rhizobium sp. BK060]|uniref:hypothetical protein n=1 Tax=Rhizobium sp. BK060 TaxID=2587096 RepID=UPI001FF026C4|nr:hypothetical protein [Rhizobium sp. BK060]